MDLSAIKNNYTCKSQNYTKLCLMQSLDCYSYSYSLIALKCMRLRLHILIIKQFRHTYAFMVQPGLTISSAINSIITTIIITFCNCQCADKAYHQQFLLCVLLYGFWSSVTYQYVLLCLATIELHILHIIVLLVYISTLLLALIT